jgi:CHAD domain-containing protein
MEEALASPYDENLHAWRKCAKTWWYQTRLLQAHDPEKAGTLTPKLGRLTGLLGDDHDLSLIRLTIGKSQSKEVAPLQTLLNQHRFRLQNRAVKLGRNLADQF